jgi:hypothetical protein
MILDIIMTVVVLLFVIALCYIVTTAFKSLFKSDSIVLSNGYLFAKEGKRPIYFTDNIAANFFIKECNWAEVYWDVYAICNGEVKHVGLSKDLILAAL